MLELNGGVLIRVYYVFGPSCATVRYHIPRVVLSLLSRGKDSRRPET